MIHLYDISRIGKFIETECRLEVTTGWGRGRGYRVSVQDDEQVLEMTGVMVAQHCKCT